VAAQIPFRLAVQTLLGHTRVQRDTRDPRSAALNQDIGTLLLRAGTGGVVGKAGGVGRGSDKGVADVVAFDSCLVAAAEVGREGRHRGDMKGLSHTRAVGVAEADVPVLSGPPGASIEPGEGSSAASVTARAEPIVGKGDASERVFAYEVVSVDMNAALEGVLRMLGPEIERVARAVQLPGGYSKLVAAGRVK